MASESIQSFVFYSVNSYLSTDAKRLIGRKFDDRTVVADRAHWPFDVVNEGGRPKIKVQYKGETKTFFPEEISSMVLTKMKETAESYLGKVCLKFMDTKKFLTAKGLS